MATVNVTWTTKQQAFAAGVTAGIWQVQLFAADGIAAVSTTQNNPANNSAAFLNVNAGNYVARVKRYDSAGNTVLASSQAAFSVVPPANNQDVPDVVNVAVS